MVTTLKIILTIHISFSILRNIVKIINEIDNDYHQLDTRAATTVGIIVFILTSIIPALLITGIWVVF